MGIMGESQRMNAESFKVRRLLATWISLALAAFCGVSAADEAALTSIKEVHSLPREVAALGKAVRVRGIVTYSQFKTTGDFAMEDEEAGIFVIAPQTEPGRERTRPMLGALVEVTGTTGPGGYAPVIHPDKVEVIGKAWLPVAQPVTVHQLLTGRFDSRRVEIRGVVQHAVHRDKVEEFGMELAGEFGRISVFALDAEGIEPVDVVDAEVTVRGVCLPFFNERSQVAGVRIEMNSAREIEINKPPRNEPFSSPEVSLDKLQPFSPAGPRFPPPANHRHGHHGRAWNFPLSSGRQQRGAGESGGIRSGPARKPH